MCVCVCVCVCVCACTFIDLGDSVHICPPTFFSIILYTNNAVHLSIYVLWFCHRKYRHRLSCMSVVSMDYMFYIQRSFPGCEI